MVTKIEPAAAIRLLDAGKAVAVDVREPDEFPDYTADATIPVLLISPLVLNIM